MGPEELGNYFRVPLDSRDLNYSLYFESGHSNPQEMRSFKSHTAERLDVENTRELLLNLSEIQEELRK